MVVSGAQVNDGVLQVLNPHNIVPVARLDRAARARAADDAGNRNGVGPVGAGPVTCIDR